MEQVRTNAVKTNDLGKRYGSFWALKNCNITIPPGSISALVGPNGAGKTTLLQALAPLASAALKYLGRYLHSMAHMYPRLAI